MNNQLFQPTAGQVSLLIAPSATIAILMEMTAELATKSQVTVVDGGNRFDGYGLARALRRRTSSIPDALQNVLLSRTFTCYQMAVLLENFAQGTLPIIVLDLLSTFLDENVRLQTRQDLLGQCLMHLQRLSQTAAVVVWVRKRSLPGLEDAGLLEMVTESAQNIWRLEAPQPEAQQLPLFSAPSPSQSHLTPPKP